MTASAKRTAKGKQAQPKRSRAEAAGGKPAKRAALSCPSCRVALRADGEVELREGGSGGGATFLLGGFAEVSESLWLLKRYTCPKCRVVTLREPR